jgi:nickel-dependent lactate racemase
MRAGIAWAEQSLDLEIREQNLISGLRAPIATNLADPAQNLRDVLEHPLDYPALRLALTPDDHIAVVVDEGIPQLARMLVPLLEHVRQARVQPDAITLICPPPSSGQPWLDELPDDFQDVHIEVHQPADRKKLAYLATTKQDRRVYLNRTAVDADQLVLMTRRGYDPLVGYSGAETALYPALCDAATAEEFHTQFDCEPPDAEPWPIQAEAREVAWLLGAPFFVQIIEGSGDAIAHVLAGPLESSPAGQRLLDARWRVEFEQPADVVLASVVGNSALHTIDDLTRAFFNAARVVKPDGSIVLFSDITPKLGPGFDLFGRHDDPALVQQLLLQEKPPDLTAAYLWATAANKARLYLLSGLPSDIAEELFAIPMQNAEQAQKLLTGQATCALLPDAHKTLAVLRK